MDICGYEIRKICYFSKYVHNCFHNLSASTACMLSTFSMSAKITFIVFIFYNLTFLESLILFFVWYSSNRAPLPNHLVMTSLFEAAFYITLTLLWSNSNLDRSYLHHWWACALQIFKEDGRVTCHYHWFRRGVQEGFIWYKN